MRVFVAAFSVLVFPSLTHAATISFRLCNKFGVRDIPILAKDKKDGMKMVYNGIVRKDSCVVASASTGSGEHAEIELKVDQGSAYGVPWIKPGDDVNF